MQRVGAGGAVTEAGDLAADEIRVATRIGMPPRTLSMRIDLLASALSELRQEPETQPEIDLARVWRSCLESWAPRLDNPAEYLDIARALNLYLQLVYESGDPQTAQSKLDSLAERGILLGMTYGGGELNDVQETFTQAYQGDGTPLGDGRDLGPIFGAMRPIRLMRDHLGHTGPLTIGSTHTLWRHCIGAHALCAPDPLRAFIQAKATPGP